ncbi:MAG: carboxypeptidase regulatory-like domain-containing protein [Deltaproteobacteria bacterium]|nr:carboxypeptidase regulatory-like domain-containing protein [Deltaproteobacteria bacterium]
MKSMLVSLLGALLFVGGTPFNAMSQQTSTNVAGTVLDQNKNPVSGVEIVGRDSAGKFFRQAITDERGRYCLANMPVGQCTITENPGKTGLKTETVKTNVREGGQTIDWSVSAPRATASIVDPGPPACTGFICLGARTINIAGTVLDQNKKPVPGIEMVARDSAGKVVRRGITDTRGRYCLAEMPVGQYSLVQNPGKTGFKGETVLTHLPEEGLTVDWGVSVPSSVAVASTPGPYSCKPFLAPTTNIAGVVVDQDKKPVAGIEIVARDSAGKLFRHAITDENGRYCLGELVPGQYSITENPGKTGFKGETVTTNVRDLGQTIDWSVSVPSAIASIADPGPSACTGYLCGWFLLPGLAPPPGVAFHPAFIPAVLGVGGALGGTICGAQGCGGGGGGALVTGSQ